jgi:hypothetical protein
MNRFDHLGDGIAPSHPSPVTPPLVARVVGIVRGREINAPANVTLDHDAVVLSWADAAAWRLELDGIEGLAAAPSALTVYLRNHDVLELTGSEALRPFALTVSDRACRMPELMRGLKRFGAVHRGNGRHAAVTTGGAPSVLQVAHDAWFAPLLAVRKAVHGVSDPSRQVALMDGAALIVAMTAAAAHIAATLAPASSAEQRALEAAIEDEATDMFAALHRLRLTGDILQRGAMDTRFADWRRWAIAAGEAYAAADEAWGAVAQIIAEG